MNCTTQSKCVRDAQHGFGHKSDTLSEQDTTDKLTRHGHTYTHKKHSLKGMEMVIAILQSFRFVFLLSLFAKVAGCNKERTALNSMSPAGVSKEALNKL